MINLIRLPDPIPDPLVASTMRYCHQSNSIPQVETITAAYQGAKEWVDVSSVKVVPFSVHVPSGAALKVLIGDGDAEMTITVHPLIFSLKDLIAIKANTTLPPSVTSLVFVSTSTILAADAEAKKIERDKNTLMIIVIIEGVICYYVILDWHFAENRR